MAGKLRSGFSLKDQLFNAERVTYLAGLFQDSHSAFNAEQFVRQVMERLPELELKQRIRHIAEVLRNFLSEDFRLAAGQIVAALPAPLDPSMTDDDFGDFIFAPLGEFVAHQGISRKHLKLSLKTLRELTMRFSMEDPIRTFINRYPDETLAVLHRWSADENYHVRRLVSEGTRPRLPWSARLDVDPTFAMPLLDSLHADPTRYVTRSVANHLNDVSRSEPAVVLQTLRRWKREARQQKAELDWMTQHALRTLVKQGDSSAMQFLGFRTAPMINIDEFAVSPAVVRRGDAIEWELKVTASRPERLLIDYVVEFMKANGRTSAKVFKAKQLQLKKGEQKIITKKHVLRANATTFTLYPGTHSVSVQINGGIVCHAEFELV